MLHERNYAVRDIPRSNGAQELASLLTDFTWCLCSGFRLGGYLFLNDATSEDGAQEYAVVRESDGVQVESITFGWASTEEAKRMIERILRGESAIDLGRPNVQLQPADDHLCQLCA